MTIILHDGKIYHSQTKDVEGDFRMNNNAETFRRVCSFYVSDWHLITMLLPYISKQVDQKVNVQTILENSIQQNIQTLLSKLQIDNEEKILQINWNSKNLLKYKSLENYMDKVTEEQKQLLLIVTGTKEYISNINSNIDKYVQTHQKLLQSKNSKIKVINCYEVMQFNDNMEEVLNKHDRVLNTSGEKEIEEVFEGYHRKQA